MSQLSDDANLFKNLPVDYNYHLINKSAEQFCFRIKEVHDETSALMWLDKLISCAKVTWRKSTTYPRSGKKNVYKVDLKCQHAKDKRVTGAGSSKKTNCLATLQIVVRRNLENTKAKCTDPLDKDWPAIITFRKEHNHSIESAEALKYRDLSSESREKLTVLFSQGHDAGSALHCLKSDLLLEHGDNYFKVASDGYYVPSYSIVHKLFEKEFSAHYGAISGENMMENLILILSQYNTANFPGRAEFSKTADGKHYFVCICSPIMMRCHQVIPQSAELVLVDASGGMDKQRHRVYFFITPTAAGGLPLAAIIVDSEKADVFEEALHCLKKILPEKSFYGKQTPELFLTDNDLKERAPLSKMFPEARLLLCQFHFLKAVWSWLCDKKNEISPEERQELYHSIKEILYTKTEKEANEKYEKLHSSQAATKYKKFLRYVAQQWERRKEWATFARVKEATRGTNTTNYVEVVFRIMKDCILNRLMAFNLTQLVSYILTRYENYMKKRLVDFCSGKYPKSVLKSMLPTKSNTKFKIQGTNSLHSFNVVNTSTEKEYTVDLSSGVCSCSVGQCGKLCIHASEVILNLDTEVHSAFNLVSQETKKIMFFVATGNSAPDGWFEPLKPSSSTTSIDKDALQYSENEASTSSHLDTMDSENIFSGVPTSNTPAPTVDTLSADEISEFRSIFERAITGTRENPAVFVPAVRKMLKNSKQFAATESGFISALCTFGAYRGLNPSKCSKVKRRSHQRIIGVQPTALGRRTSDLSGKKKISTGCPRGKRKIVLNMKHHDYTAFGTLPPRKRKATHNLQDCVYANKGLGSTKQAKGS